MALYPLTSIICLASWGRATGAQLLLATHHVHMHVHTGTVRYLVGSIDIDYVSKMGIFITDTDWW